MKIYRYQIHGDGKSEKLCRDINIILKDDVSREFMAVSDYGKIFINFQWQWCLCSPFKLNDCQVEKFKRFCLENYKKKII